MLRCCRLHNYGISIHLLQAENEELDALPPADKEINSRDDHLSFQVRICQQMCSIMAMDYSATSGLRFFFLVRVQSECGVVGVEELLKEHGIKYSRTTLDENGVKIEQVFFHDPDGFMIEICTCENFPVKPLVDGAPNPIQRTSSICSLGHALSAR